MELDALLKDPILDVQAARLLGKMASRTRTYHQPYCDKIANRFLQADSTLILSLGMVNYERYLRCLKERSNNQELVKSALDFPIPEGTVGGDSKFHDSGLGTSVSSGPAYAETVMSYSGGEGGSVRIPPLPQEAKRGEAFECLACGLLVSFRNNSAWKKHLYGNLRPWRCLELTCTPERNCFKDRNAWISHLTLEHDFRPTGNRSPAHCAANTPGLDRLPSRHILAVI